SAWVGVDLDNREQFFSVISFPRDVISLVQRNIFLAHESALKRQPDYFLRGSSLEEQRSSCLKQTPACRCAYRARPMHILNRRHGIYQRLRERHVVKICRG